MVHWSHPIMLYRKWFPHEVLYMAIQTHTHAESPTAVGPVHNTNDLVEIIQQLPLDSLSLSSFW